MRNNVLVLGLGNILLADDGVGVHIVRHLNQNPATPPWLHAVDGGTMGFRLTSILEDANDVLIVDAAELSAAPGEIRLLDAETLTAGTGRTSAHEAGLADLLSLLRLQDTLPRRLAVLAIQPQHVGWGETLSEPVANSIVPACDIINSWCRQP